MKTMTVEELLIFCGKEIDKGNGKKKIYISDDDEGNGYHALMYAFTLDKDLLLDTHTNTYNDDIDDIIVLG